MQLLGFRVFYNYKLLKHSNAKRIQHELQNLFELYSDGATGKNEIYKNFDGWNAYAIHANTYKFRRRLMKRTKTTLKNIDKSILYVN